MSRYSYSLTALLCFAALAACACGCTDGGADNPDAVSGTGTVVYNNLEGGFYGIVTDEGTHYLPLNLPDVFAEDNLVITFTGIVRVTTYAGMTLIFEFIFFLAAGLGVLNTMLMATYERIPEFGLIKAIGASPGRVVADVLSEALVLGVAASLIGGPTGTLIAWYLARHPLDLSGFAEGFNTSGVALSTDWGAVVTLPGTLVPVVFLWLVVLLAALYPAVKAARLDPVEALAHV